MGTTIVDKDMSPKCGREISSSSILIRGDQESTDSSAYLPIIVLSMDDRTFLMACAAPRIERACLGFKS